MYFYMLFYYGNRPFEHIFEYSTCNLMGQVSKTVMLTISGLKKCIINLNIINDDLNHIIFEIIYLPIRIINQLQSTDNRS